MVQPFCSDLAFRCVRRKRSFARAPTFESWSGHAAVLFVDLSGYSKITSALADRGAFLLSAIVNDYLAELLRIVQLFGGDVVKFAGDAILVVWECVSEETLPLNILCAAQCVLQMQELAGNHPVEGTDGLSFRIHCGLCAGALDTEVFCAPPSKAMQRLYHVVSGDPLIEIGDLVECAKAGETCTSWEVAACLAEYNAVFHDDDAEYGKLLVQLEFDEATEKMVDEHISTLRANRRKLRVPQLEEEFINPAVLDQLQHGGTHIAQMRNLCVLFISKTSSGNSANWLMEVYDVLGRHRCPIVQIIDDDKGVHLTAAVNLHESVPEATKLALDACHDLLFKQVGCAVGMAMGGTFCGITGSAEIACRWDITGAPVVRAARLMQYALKEGLEVAIDQSVYNHASMSAMMQPHACIFLKGSKKPATIYTLSPSRSVAASMILESFAFAPLHETQVVLLQEFLLSGESRGAAIVTGPALCGKKVVCQRAAGLAHMTPILHVSDATAGLFQIGRTLSDWFLHHFDDQVRTQAQQVKDDLKLNKWSRAHDECVKLITSAIKSGYKGCIVVDRVQDLDQFSMSLIRESLVAHRHRRKLSLSDRQGTSYSEFGSSSVFETDDEKGMFFFLCSHEPLYDSKEALCIKKELVRAHRVDVPIIEVAEASREDLKRFVEESVDLGVEDSWLDIYARTAGYRAGYLFQRIRRLRIMSAQLVVEGKTPMSIFTDKLTAYVPDRMARHIKAVNVTQISPDTAMRFGRVFDELPPSYQTFVQVVTIATRRCFYHVPLTAVTMAMHDLFVEVEEEAFPVLSAVKELEELFILKVEGKGASKRVHLRCPGFTDTVAAVCTPVQAEAMALHLAERLEEGDFEKTHVDYLAIAALCGTLGDVAQQYNNWRLAYAKFLEGASEMDETTANSAKEQIEEEIEVAGCNVETVLGVSLDIERSDITPLDPKAVQLKYYSGPVTFGPLGHTLSVISRNCFREMRAYHGECENVLAVLRADIASGVARYIAQVGTVESYLEKQGWGTSAETLAQEASILQKLTKSSCTEISSSEKVALFLDQLVTNHVEPRMERLRNHVKQLREQLAFPIVIKNAPEAIFMAYRAMRKDTYPNDAVQDALVTLASFNWVPKQVPENLPKFYYQTVATIRYRLLRKLSEGEVILFRHEHVFHDLDAFLIMNALLPENDSPQVM